MPSTFLTPDELEEQARLERELQNPSPFSYGVPAPTRTQTDPDEMLKNIGIDRTGMDKAMEYARSVGQGARGQERMMAAGDRLGAAIAGQKYDEAGWNQRVNQAGASATEAEKDRQAKVFMYAKLLAEGRKEEAEAFLKQQSNYEHGRSQAYKAHQEELGGKRERLRKLGDEASRREFAEEARRDSQRFQSGQNDLSRKAQIEAANIANQRKIEGERRDSSLPGDPNYIPSPQDAKTVKDTDAAAYAMNKAIDQLKGLHRAHGTELGGEVATKMNNLRSSLILAGKNLETLGALSASDIKLVEDLLGQDPTSIKANLKAMVGFDTTESGLDALRDFIQTKVEAQRHSRGYPVRVPEPTRLPPGDIDLSSLPDIRVRYANGQEGVVSADKLEEAKKHPGKWRVVEVLQ